MNNADYELDDYNLNLSPSRADELNKRRSRSKAVPWPVFALWGVLLLGAFGLAQYYNHSVQTKLEDIRRTNQMNVDQLSKSISGLQTQLEQNRQDAQQLQKQFQDVQTQLAAVKEEMALAGDSLSSTDATKKALSQRITDLSTELTSLQASIKKLEDAARVY